VGRIAAAEPLKGIFMLRKIGTILVIVPLAVTMIAFAIANRQWVTVSVDPFSSTNPAYMANLPLFIVIFASLFVGVLIGGFAAWAGQAKWRRTARRLDGEVQVLRQELETVHRLAAKQSMGNHARETARHRAISPPSS
jgi:uncharacterized integral membrane protein